MLSEKLSRDKIGKNTLFSFTFSRYISMPQLDNWLVDGTRVSTVCRCRK